MALDKTKERIAAQMKSIKALTSKKIEAGWFESARYLASDKGDEGVQVAKIARINEFGTDTIPARPFMRLAIDNFRRDRNSIQSRINKRVADGKITADQALGQIGMAMEAKIVDSIKDGQWEANAASTIAAKGFDKPLIDTAQMWKSVSSKVT
ncbi:hypothetical protein [Xanthomonas phage Carpasina]|uniref:Uncharacterized protein n=1 Tax=Xanthomonas phage Carpasina TaxID=2163636 RepID=A0A2S1GSN4_9CAUD|nr:tail completion or Neck1 protein [Xanthomonas phage Carpasina]AWD92410.1 hypothetical protein [Xanthomonas phage Carpasina]